MGSLRVGELRRHRCAWAIGALTLLSVVNAPAAAQRVDYVGSFQSSAGQYVFDETTVSHSFLSGLSLIVDSRWRLGGSIAVIIQDNGVLTQVGGQQVPTGGQYSGVMRGREPGERVPMRGRSALDGAALIDSAAAPVGPGDYEVAIGDLLLNAGFDVLSWRGGMSRVSTQLMAKLPVATVESGVGTGAFDYGAGVSFSAGLGRLFGYADVSHWVLGDMPDLPLRDITGGAAGLGLLFGTDQRWSVMGSVAGSSSAIENVEGPLSTGASIGYRVSGARSLTTGVAFGLTESSPDWTAHVGWRFGLR